MKSILVFGMLAFALSFCGIVNRFTSQGSQSNSGAPSIANSTTAQGGGDKNITFEKPELSSSQKVLADGGKETKWDEQGMTWKLPQGWKKMSQSRNSFNWSGGNDGFMLINISPMASDFPAEASIKANYDSAVTRMKNGEVEKVRYLEIDGVKGVEFVEVKAENGSDARRHQWLAFRNYAGQMQMLNLMLASKDSSFEKNREQFAAILYSTKIIDQGK